MRTLRTVTEEVARRTTRRGLFGRGASGLFGALAGAAAGTSIRRVAVAGVGTECAFPGRPCDCDKCQSNGVCGKPCHIYTAFYASGCWVESENDATCCDCACPYPAFPDDYYTCGCGSDYHNNPEFCPQ